MRATVFHDMHTLYPDRIVNKTNGITFRRWLFEANPGLTAVLVEFWANACSTMPAALEGFAAFADDSSMHARLAAIRRANKVALSNRIMDTIADQDRSGRDLRRADQAHPRIQAPVAEHPGDRGAV